MPRNWAKAIITPIHKKGDKTDCRNYRGIALLDTTYKILATAIKGKLSKYAEKILGEYQCGFRPYRSVMDQIFVLKEMQTNCYEHKIVLYALFIDFQQAYDTVDRRQLYKALQELGIPNKIINLVRMTHQNTENKVRVHGNISESFKIGKGLRQGDPISAILFNLALEMIVRKSNINREGTIYIKNHQCLAYADDITIITRTKKDLKRVVKNLAEQAEKIGLKINEKKTKYMEMGRNEKTTNAQEEQSILIKIRGNKELKCEKVESVTFLGTLITSNSAGSEEIKARLIKGDRCAGALNEVLMSKEVSKRTKIRIYKTVIRPTVLYGSETWVLNKADQNSIEIWERKILRRIYGGKRTEEGWERRTNQEVLQLYNEPTITKVAKAQRLRWLGHIERMTQDRITKKILRGGLTETRRRGRPRRRWLDAVKEDLRELGIFNWKEKIKKKQEWKAVVQKAQGL